MKMQSEEEEFVLSKFKRYGQRITKRSLEKTLQWMSQNKSHKIDDLLKKMGQLALQNPNHDENLQHSIQILSMKGKNLSSYQQLIEEARRRSIYYLSPYESQTNLLEISRPNKELFLFEAEDHLRMYQDNFKRISLANKQIPKGAVLGVLYQNYTNLTMSGKPRLMLQNEVNEIQVQFPENISINTLLIQGCSYIFAGKQIGRDLSFQVSQIILPNHLPEPKSNLLKKKFKHICQNISSGKESLGFSPSDFTKYDCVYTSTEEPFKPSLLFSNITINLKTVNRLRKLVQGFPQGVSAIILMLSGQHQQEIDLSFWLKCTVYLIPHIISEGPRLLPKLPLLKTRIPSAKLLTNPARLSIQGKQIMLVNYPLVKNIYNNCLLSEFSVKIAAEQMTSKVADLIFSQGTVALVQQIYWRQASYFHINADTTVIINDSAAAGFQKNKGRGGMAISGDFQNDGDFICLMSRAKNFIQYSQEPSQ